MSCKNNKNKLTISVVMANYNYGKYIGEAIDAIVKQSFRPTEFIIIDDGSTDNSVSIIKKFQIEYPWIKLIQNKKNIGGHNAINIALNEATGDYIYSAASDDKILPGFIEKSMNLLSENTKAGLSCSDYIVNVGKINYKKKLNLSNKPQYYSPEESVRLFMKHDFTPIIANSTIIKRSALLEAGGYMPKHKWSCDTFAHHVVTFRYGFCYIPEVLTFVRAHAAQYGASSAKNSKLERELIRTLMDSIQTSPYRDVLMKFERTAPFSVSPWDVLMVVISNKKYHKFMSFKLLRFAILEPIIKQLSNIVLISPVIFIIYRIQNMRWRFIISLFIIVIMLILLCCDLFVSWRDEQKRKERK